MRRAVVVTLLIGCGRVAFDTRPADAPPDSDGATCAATDPDLVGCWDFDGNTLDGSRYHNDATQVGVTFGPGHDDTAVQVSAQTQLLVALSTSLDAADALTIEAWIELDAYPPGLAYVLDNNDQYAFGINADGTLYAIVVMGGTPYASYFNGVHPVGLGSWHHVAMRYDIAATFDLVVDGVVDASLPASGPIIGNGTDGSRIAGDAGPVETPPLIGSIDDVRVWRVARSTAQL